MKTFRNQKTFLTECLSQHVEFGEFELSSGGTSSVYINVKPLLLDSFCLSYIAIRLCGLIDSNTNAIAGVGYSGALLVPAILTAIPRPMSGLVIREEQKRHGRFTQIEGDLAIRNQNIVLVDDVLSTGSSLRFATEHLKKFRDCNTIQWVIIVDRTLGKEIYQTPPIASLFDVRDIPGFNDEYKIRTEVKD